MKLNVGDIVTITNNRPKEWFKTYPVILTVTVDKVFKNGNFSCKIKTVFGIKAQHFNISDII